MEKTLLLQLVLGWQINGVSLKLARSQRLSGASANASSDRRQQKLLIPALSKENIRPNVRWSPMPWLVLTLAGRWSFDEAQIKPKLRAGGQEVDPADLDRKHPAGAVGGGIKECISSSAHVGAAS
jgi:hypothetical protein